MRGLPKEHYPKAVAERSGCKVGWKTFATEADARKASSLARREAAYLEKQGYEWGYQTPGAIRKVEQGWEVTIP